MRCFILLEGSIRVPHRIPSVLSIPSCCGTPLRRGWVHGGSGGGDRLGLAPEFLQQRFRVLDVRGVKALSEAAEAP